MSNMTDIKRLICFTSKFGWVSIKILCLEKTDWVSKKWVSKKNIESRKKYGIPKKILGFKLKLRRKQCFCKLKNELKIEETQVTGPKIIRNFDLKTHIFFSFAEKPHIFFRLRRNNPYFFSASPKTNIQKTHTFFSAKKTHTFCMGILVYPY